MSGQFGSSHFLLEIHFAFAGGEVLVAHVLVFFVFFSIMTSCYAAQGMAQRGLVPPVVAVVDGPTTTIGAGKRLDECQQYMVRVGKRLGLAKQAVVDAIAEQDRPTTRSHGRRTPQRKGRFAITQRSVEASGRGCCRPDRIGSRSVGRVATVDHIHICEDVDGHGA